MRTASAVLALLVIACGPVSTAVEAQGTAPRAAGKLTEEVATARLQEFLRADRLKKQEMLSPKFLEVAAGSDFLSETFSKEAYQVLKIIELQPYKGREPVDEKTYLKVQLRWAFEGFEGDQTCHFDVVRHKGKWVIDWFLC